jgi:hypothetical protein
MRPTRLVDRARQAGVPTPRRPCGMRVGGWDGEGRRILVPGATDPASGRVQPAEVRLVTDRVAER